MRFSIVPILTSASEGSEVAQGKAGLPCPSEHGGQSVACKCCMYFFISLNVLASVTTKHETAMPKLPVASIALDAYTDCFQDHLPHLQLRFENLLYTMAVCSSTKKAAG
jgi:hypothetical protein